MARTMVKTAFLVLVVSLLGSLALALVGTAQAETREDLGETVDLTDSAEAGASTVIDSIAEDAAAFPIFMGLIALVVAAVLVWFTVEMAKATALSKLKRRPPKTAGEETVIGVIAKQFHWYPLLIWLINLTFGSGSGIGVGAIDGFDQGELGWWGIPFGVVGGLLSKVLAQYGRKLSDKASDILLGRLKRLLGGNGSDG